MQLESLVRVLEQDGLGNRLIDGVPKPSAGVVLRHERLGGILSHYYKIAPRALVRVLEQDAVARELGHGGDSLIKRVYGHLGTVRHRSEHAEFRIEQHRDRDEIRDRLRGLRVA